MAPGTTVDGVAAQIARGYLRAAEDASRNGSRTLNQLVEHAAHDSLVGWAWKPGVGREAAPGNQASFGALIKAWADSGAACPPR